MKLMEHLVRKFGPGIPNEKRNICIYIEPKAAPVSSLELKNKLRNRGISGESIWGMTADIRSLAENEVEKVIDNIKDISDFWIKKHIPSKLKIDIKQLQGLKTMDWRRLARHFEIKDIHLPISRTLKNNYISGSIKVKEIEELNTRFFAEIEDLKEMKTHYLYSQYMLTIVLDEKPRAGGLKTLFGLVEKLNIKGFRVVENNNNGPGKEKWEKMRQNIISHLVKKGKRHIFDKDDESRKQPAHKKTVIKKTIIQ